MRIAIVATVSKAVSADSTGGTEYFCYLLASGLARHGHEVTLLASGDSVVPGVRLIPTVPAARNVINDRYRRLAAGHYTEREHTFTVSSTQARIVSTVLKHAGEFDLIHDNTGSPELPAAADLIPVPMVSTMHMPPSTFPFVYDVPSLLTPSPPHYAAVSDYERKTSPVPAELVYNGIDMSGLAFDAAGGDRYVWIGRIDPHTPKGLPEALQITGTAGVPFAFAGVYSDQAYYDREIAARMGPSATAVGTIVGATAKSAFLGKARAALFPIQWEEPFGFVFVEAMACGTPVIAYGRGSVPEIVEDGVTGFVVNPSDTDKRGDFTVKTTGPAGIREAMDRLSALSPAAYRAMRLAARNRAVSRFGSETMVEGYERLYRRLVPGIVQPIPADPDVQYVGRAHA
jgi:glycosyltransferase involved in cell wall biosynthesis